MFILMPSPSTSVMFAVQTQREKSVPLSLEDVLNRLIAYRIALAAHSVVHASVFGSAARGTATSGSDLDIAGQFTPGSAVDGFTYASLREDLRRRLSEIMECSVDVADVDTMRQAVKAEFEKEAIHAF